MRINLANLLIALTISALLGYGLWAAGDDLKNYVGVGSFAYLAGTLCPAIGIQYELERSAVNLRVVCGIFFTLGLALNLGFALMGTSAIAYIVSAAVSFLVYLFVAGSIYSARE
jgi:hypothetical protein